MKIRPRHTDFNIAISLPLWEAARRAELRALPPAARRLAIRHHLDSTTARLIAALAGIGDGGAHE